MNRQRTRIDLGTILGLALGVGSILGGLVLEGGKLSDIAQLTGGIIVLFSDGEVHSFPEGDIGEVIARYPLRA